MTTGSGLPATAGTLRRKREGPPSLWTRFRLSWDRWWLAYAMLVPTLVVMGVLVFYPLARGIYLSFTNADHTIRATLVFNDDGELTNFWSDDRRRASADGKALEAVRWSTPVGSYRAFGPVRLAARGEGRWHDEGGEYAYLELELDEVEYNVPAR